jgi:hypothetical protein
MQQGSLRFAELNMPTISIGSSVPSRVLAGAVLFSMASFAMAAAPVISGTPAPTVKVGNWYGFRPIASDADGNKLTYSIANKPTWLSFNTSTGSLYATAKTAGKWSNIVVSVSDGTTKVSLPAFSIVVWTPNTAPTISGSPATTASVGTAYSFQPTAADANGDALGFSIANKPSWAAFSTSTGRLSGTPSAAGTFGNIVISVSDGKTSKSLPAFAINVSGTANRVPTISGTALRSINANSAYSFRPTAADADGDTLAYSIANKPAWASFSTTTGLLSGTPSGASVGTYSNVIISVSDGKASAALPAFAITVNAVSIGGATLSWSAPSQNTDGSALTNLAGYRIYYGTSATALTQMVQVNGVGVSSYVIENLAPSTYFFAVRAYTSAGAESSNSNTVTKIVQ